MDTEFYRQALQSAVGGRRWILFGLPLAPLVPQARLLKKLGAEAVFLVGSGPGTGDPPDPDEFPHYALDASGSDIIAGFRRYEAGLRQPPRALREALDRFDPDHTALCLAEFTLAPIYGIAGRRRFGAAPAPWTDLEDKVRVDALWQAAAIPRAPSVLVPMDGAAWQASWKGLDRGHGLVAAADARDGLHGGGVGVRWMQQPDQIPATVEALSPRSDRVRLMPFLEGLPCSIHGFVLADGIAVFRPVEMVILRRPEKAEFFYGGMATFWDPPESGAEAMRRTARRVGETLARRYAYRGCFTIDGVLSPEGFFPTELNARVGAALPLLEMEDPAVKLSFLSALVVEVNQAMHPQALENLVLQHSREHRAGRGGSVLPFKVQEEKRVELVYELDLYREALEDEVVQANMALGPNDSGAFLSFAPDPASLSIGPPFAPRVVAAFAAADRLWGTGIGKLEAAPNPFAD